MNSNLPIYSLHKQTKVYLAPGENPPEGMNARIGKRGGRFYVSATSDSAGDKNELSPHNSDSSISGFPKVVGQMGSVGCKVVQDLIRLDPGFFRHVTSIEVKSPEIAVVSPFGAAASFNIATGVMKLDPSIANHEDPVIIEGIIKHEVGHSLWGKMTDSEREKFSEAWRVETTSTVYVSSKSRKSSAEGFAEVFRVDGHPAYRVPRQSIILRRMKAKYG